MKIIKVYLLTSILSSSFGLLSFAQCKTWNGLPNMEALTEAHSVYRGYVKNENYKDAFPFWEQVYNEAPAADGRRDFHYTDGIKIYKAFYKEETDEAKKEEYVAKVLKFYDEAVDCYASRIIRIKYTGDEEQAYNIRMASLIARKGYDMYYTFRSPYDETIAALKKALDTGGNSTEYTVVVPYAKIAVYQFLKEKLTKEETREVHDRLLELCDSNIASAGKFASYYQQAKENVLADFRTIEFLIFDCEYFKAKWMPEYEENKEDAPKAKDLYNRLRARGCEDSDPFLAKLSAQWEAYAEVENARRQAEFEANNPGILAKKAYDAGDFTGAIRKYREAIDDDEDLTKQAGYYFSIASTMFRKLKRYESARVEARIAAKLRPGWGRPYALIGDMYSRTANSCGDSWNQSLAVLAACEKWRYAMTLELSEEEATALNGKLSRYRKYFPAREEGFMKGVKPGTSQKVGCWIGESVKVRYKS